MDIEVRLFATFRQGRFNRQVLQFPDASQVSDICRTLLIQPQDIAICLVNGREAERDQTVNSGDCVSLFPAVGGG
jgi:molybdopterin converting factor small subunit